MKGGFHDKTGLKENKDGLVTVGKIYQLEDLLTSTGKWHGLILESQLTSNRPNEITSC